MSNVFRIRHVILAILLLPYKLDVHNCQNRHSAITIRRKRSSAATNVHACKKKRLQQLERTNFCTYCPTSPAFDPKREMLRRPFFINALDYLPLLEFRVVRRGCGPTNLTLSDEQVHAMAEGLPILRQVICCGETLVGVRG